MSKKRSYNSKDPANSEVLSLSDLLIKSDTDDAARSEIAVRIAELGALPSLLKMFVTPDTSDVARYAIAKVITNLSFNPYLLGQFLENLDKLPGMLTIAAAPNTSDITRQQVAVVISGLLISEDFYTHFVNNIETLLPAILTIATVPNANYRTKQEVVTSIFNLSSKQDFRAKFAENAAALLPVLLTMAAATNASGYIKQEIATTIFKLGSLPALLAMFTAPDASDAIRQGVAIVIINLSKDQIFCDQFSANGGIRIIQPFLKMFAADNVSDFIKQNVALTLKNLLSFSQDFLTQFAENAAVLLPDLLAIAADPDSNTRQNISTTIMNLSCNQDFCTQFAVNAAALSILLTMLSAPDTSNIAKQQIVITIANLLQNQEFRTRFIANTEAISIVLREIAVNENLATNDVTALTFVRIIKAIPILEFANVLATPGFSVQRISNFLEAPELFHHKLVCKAEGVRDVFALLKKTAYANSQISTRHLVKLIFGFLTEDLDKRIINSAQLPQEQLAEAKILEAGRLASELNDANTLRAILSPENLPWTEALSEQYLRHCVNNRVWGVVTLFCMAEIANAPTMQAKRDSARNLMLVSVVKMQAIESVNKEAASQKLVAQQRVDAVREECEGLLAQLHKEKTQGALNEEERLKAQELEKKILDVQRRLNEAREAQRNMRGPANVEVELANLLLIRVLLKLDKKLPGAPGQIAYEGAVISKVTDELVENTCAVIKEQVFRATNDALARFLCNAENSQAWAAMAFPDTIKHCEDEGKKIAKFAGAIMEKRMEEKMPELKNSEPSQDSQELSPDDQKLFERLSTLDDENLARASTEERICAEISKSVEQSTLAAFASLDSQSRPASDVRVTAASDCKDESVNMQM